MGVLALQQVREEARVPLESAAAALVVGGGVAALAQVPPLPTFTPTTYQLPLPPPSSVLPWKP